MPGLCPKCSVNGCRSSEKNCLLQLHPITELVEFGYCSMSITDIKRNYVSQFWWVNLLLFLEITNLNNHLQNSACLANIDYFQEAVFAVTHYLCNSWKKTICPGDWSLWLLSIIFYDKLNFSGSYLNPQIEQPMPDLRFSNYLDYFGFLQLYVLKRGLHSFHWQTILDYKRKVSVGTFAFIKLESKQEGRGQQNQVSWTRLPSTASSSRIWSQIFLSH